MKTDIFALALHNEDFVAVMTTEGKAGNKCTISGSNIINQVELNTDIPMSHKVALKDMKIGEEVLKFGQPIGIVTQAISTGEHVHVHNISGLRTDLRGRQV